MFVNRSVYLLAMGGNLPIGEGSPVQVLSLTLREMARRGLVIRAVSRFFETPCYPPGAGPDFANAVVEVASELGPVDLLAQLHEIERSYGRTRERRWGARTLDLDLLAAGNMVYPDRETVRHWMELPPDAQQGEVPEGLILPHPRLQDRAFVLVPLCDIAPDWVHPLLHQSAQALCRALGEDEIAAIRPV